MDKEILRVYAAIAKGCRTSHDCSAVTGISIKNCSHYLGEMGRAGLLRVERDKVKYTKRGGRKSHWYFIPNAKIQIQKAEKA
jgi:hypothetical protein